MPFLTSQGDYYEGDRNVYTDVSVPVRPSLSHKWVNDAWQIDYDDAKSRALLMVNNAAGSARQKYITEATGQELTYQLKEKQCREFKSAGYPAGSVPVMVQAEMDAFGVTGQVAADGVIAIADQWIVIAADVEMIRRQSVALIDVAIASDSGLSAIETIRDSAVAALGLI